MAHIKISFINLKSQFIFNWKTVSHSMNTNLYCDLAETQFLKIERLRVAEKNEIKLQRTKV